MNIVYNNIIISNKRLVVNIIIKKNNLKSNFTNYIPNKFKELFSQDFVIIDIETTGFSRTNSSVILIGLLIKTDSEYYLKQIFCESLSEEKELLIILKDTLENYNNSFLISYNGHSFDIPYLNSKYNSFNINYQINRSNNFDIYRLIRKYKNKLNLNKYNLKSVEKLLNINRKDTISGKDSIKLYFDYLKNKSETTLKTILLHNYEDILYLVPILEILDYFNLNELLEFFPKKIINSTFLSTSKLKKDFLYCTFESSNILNLNYFDEYLSLKSASNEIKLKINIKKISLDNDTYSFINYQIIYNNSWENLSSESKNNLIIAINDKIQYNNLITNLKIILHKIYKND